MDGYRPLGFLLGLPFLVASHQPAANDSPDCLPWDYVEVVAGDESEVIQRVSENALRADARGLFPARQQEDVSALANHVAVPVHRIADEVWRELCGVLSEADSPV